MVEDFGWAEQVELARFGDGLRGTPMKKEVGI